MSGQVGCTKNSLEREWRSSDIARLWSSTRENERMMRVNDTRYYNLILSHSSESELRKQNFSPTMLRRHLSPNHIILVTKCKCE